MQLTGITTEILETINRIEQTLQPQYRRFEACSLFNQNKVLEGFSAVRVESRHFSPSTGYGYDDAARDTLDRLFAHVFRAESALVRPQFANATHALTTALFAVLRPGDDMLSVTGEIYDTLQPVVGKEGRGDGSLGDFGIGYHEIPLREDPFGIDVEGVCRMIESNTRIKLIYIQRSGGYDGRPALSIDAMEEAITAIRKKRPNAVVVVDNCYGEFTMEKEPLEAGADLIVGSLIKNPGGGLAPTGAYIAGKTEWVERAAYRLTAPGIGSEVGSYAASYQPFYQGLFMAPVTVCAALKGAVLLAAAMQSLGYDLMPAVDAPRSDIIQAIRFGDKDSLTAFCRAVQAASPVEAHVTPEPWPMPGYAHEVIMAAGTFVQGASMELTADAPIREPYIGYWQGGLTYEHCKLAVMRIYESLSNK